MLNLPVGVGKGITALPPLQTGRAAFTASGFPEKDEYFDSTVPFSYGTAVASRASPRLCTLRLQEQFCLSFYLLLHHVQSITPYTVVHV